MHNIVNKMILRQEAGRPTRTNKRRLDILSSSNHNIHKSFRGLRFLAPDPLIDRF